MCCASFRFVVFRIVLFRSFFLIFYPAQKVALAASAAGRSDPRYSLGVGQTVAPKAALSVYSFFLEEAFSPRRER